jgi:hypothetical protein
MSQPDPHSAGSQAQPVLHRAAQPGQSAGSGWGKRPGAVQPLLSSPIWISKPRSDAQPGVEQFNELRLPLRWIAILYGRIQADMALTSGVHTAQDVLKAMMAGASVTMLPLRCLMNGTTHQRNPDRYAGLDGDL